MLPVPAKECSEKTRMPQRAGASSNVTNAVPCSGDSRKCRCDAKAGGYLVYSTCTFSPEENEGMISEFLSRHKNYDILEIPKAYGIDNGRPNGGTTTRNF